MCLATCEDKTGMWRDDPIAANTEDECRTTAMKSGLPCQRA